MTSEARRGIEDRRQADGLCTAKIWHGPGHQSSTYCERRGPHWLHQATYGEFRQHAEWEFDEGITGFFDEPDIRQLGGT